VSSPETGPFPKVLTLHLELSQYPILAGRIRERMRQEIFNRGVITPHAFEAEVREKAIQSQRREGLSDPFGEEPPDTWSRRLEIVREQLTDFYFAHNLPHEDFERLVHSVLDDRIPSQDVVLTFHPELAPWDMLFAQGEAYEALPADERARVVHDLREIKVVLIKSMLSDHLKYLGVAKDWLDISDLKKVRSRRLGRGKIGGKAAGIILAGAVLRKSASPDFLRHLTIPPSWFIGADVFYQFTQLNGLLGYANQKYRDDSEIREAYPALRLLFTQGAFPDEIVSGLEELLVAVGRSPLIVRSSSLLEDSFGTSFAGKYESFFLPNQGRPDANLAALLSAIASVYASVYSPEALFYRQRMGLVDYDERMAILIQVVQGEARGAHFLPDAAGVAFSRNQFRWSPRIDRGAGFLRLVWGLGTRAVETLDGDYPRLVALSHPELRPESEAGEIRRYSQHFVDTLNFESNRYETLPVPALIRAGAANLPLIAQRFVDGDLQDFASRPLHLDEKEVVITFKELLSHTPFPAWMQHMLGRLEQAYQTPVDTEFALLIHPGDHRSEPRLEICLLQCRPQSQLEEKAVRLPPNVPASRRLFHVRRIVPEGRVTGIEFVLYAVPGACAALAASDRHRLAQVIGQFNELLGGRTYILMGPGRWGSVNTDLGIPVSYADIYHARALVEIFEADGSPEPSYGTHFFQDLVEARIYPLAIAVDDPATEFQRTFFEESTNLLATWLPDKQQWEPYLRLIDVRQSSSGATMELVMDGEADQALAYLATDQPEEQET
jgi:Pyruvate phosphate dikinase, AMP/ATP-binding domain